MTYDDFLNRVQTKASIEQKEEAAQVLEASLETLGERIERTEQRNLAAQLVDELKEFVLKRNQTDHYDLEEFYNRVAARSGQRYPEASEGARAVMKVLQEAVHGGEMDDIRRTLPDVYDELFGKGQPGAMSP
jgi:uncharacterized protein (DUF2267 family)